MDRLARVVTEGEANSAMEGGSLMSMSIRLPCECNLRCQYCYGRQEPHGKTLEFDEVRDVLSQAAGLGARTISVTGEGEPLLYPHFRGFVGCVDWLGMIPTIYSNCTLMTPELAGFLYRHNATVIGKQNAMAPGSQDRISGVSGAYDMMAKGLACLVDTGFAKTKPSRLGMHTVVLKDNLGELPEMWHQWGRGNILPQVQALVYPSRNQGAEYFGYYRCHAPSPPELRRLFEGLARIDSEEFGIVWDPARAYPIAPDGCRTQCAIAGLNQNGDVQICSYTEDPLGNIRDAPLKDILNSPKVRRIRHVGEELGYPAGGYGCRANALNMTGDRFGPDPYFDEFLKAGTD